MNVVFLLPFTTYLLKRTLWPLLSKSIEEAAFVDGCTRLQTMVYIILPNALPGFASVMVYTFINSWLNYLYPYALIADMNSRTMPQTLLALIGQYGNNYPSLTAASILTLLPPLVFLYFPEVVYRRLIRNQYEITALIRGESMEAVKIGILGCGVSPTPSIYRAAKIEGVEIIGFYDQLNPRSGVR